MMKRQFLTLMSVLIVATLALSPVTSVAMASAPRQGEQPQDDGFVPGELIVVLEQGESGPDVAVVQAVMDTAAALGAEIVPSPVASSYILVRFKSDEELQSNMQAFAALPGVASVERNRIFRVPSNDDDDFLSRDGSVVREFVPKDPSRGSQWYLDKILDTLTATPTTKNVPCIVIFDTGVDYTHPDLAGKVFLGFDFVDNDSDPMDIHGHGTRIAGVAAARANNAQGISGVSPFSNILAVRVLRADGGGETGTIASGINWANQNLNSGSCGGQEPKIYLLSFYDERSVIFPDEEANRGIVSNAIATARAMGRLVIGVAGKIPNFAYQNTPLKTFPGTDPNVFSVAATEENDRRAFTAVFDSSAESWVDIAAPGYNIFTTDMGGAYVKIKSDATMAGPVVAGAAARVWASFPTLTVAKLMERLVATADLTTGGFLTTIKRVNLYKALTSKPKMTLQGQVFDAGYSAPLKGASVTVTLAGKKICGVVTKDSGFYSCALPGKGTYQVMVKKTKYISNTQNFVVKSSLFGANLTMAKSVGATSGDWSVTLLWKGWQPFSDVGKQLDLWVYKAGTTPKCEAPFWYPYTAPAASSNKNIFVGVESWNVGQTEWVKIRKANKGKVEIWVTLYAGGDGYEWPTSSRLTGSGAVVAVYKNNTRIAQLTVPAKPVLPTSDAWQVGSIDLNAGVWKSINKIKDYHGAPKCSNVYLP